MSSNGAVFPPPSPQFTTAQQQTTFPETTTPSSSSASSSSPDDDSFSPSIVITALVLATAIIFSASIYLLLRCIRSRCRHRRRNRSNSQISAFSSDARNHRQGRVAPEEIDTSLADSLPIFTFASLSGGGGGGSNNNGDCAVCLSKFEAQDRLRLLPACCHAFHADCIDAWLVTNQTCPLCRSSIFLSDADLINKTLPASSSSASAAASSRSGSFRVEIGSVSRRQQRPSDFTGTGTGRSYSIGSFDYVIDDDDDNHATVISEVAVGPGRRVSTDKIDQTEIAVAPGESVAAGVGGRSTTSWLKEYVDRLGWTAAASSFSLSSSLRSSGRFFGGGIGLGIGSTSSRRTETPRVQDSDLEASRLGDDIGEMFRWLSGV